MTTTETDGPGLALEAKFSLAVDALGAHTAELRRIRRRLDTAVMQPVHRTFPSVVTIPANQVGVAWFGGPDQGHVWYVRGLVVGGLTPATVAAGRADVFVTGTDLRLAAAAGGLADFGTQDWRDQLPAMPASKFYGHDLHVRAPEDLFVVFSNASAAQQYVAVVSIEDQQEGIAIPVSAD